MNLRIVQVFALLCLASASAASDPPDLRSAVFAVTCYDVGKLALTGLPGVQDVSTGWRSGQEVNLVRYDPSAIGHLEMEKALRARRPTSGRSAPSEAEIMRVLIIRMRLAARTD